MLDGTYSQGATAIRAGAFATGSKITLILVNGFDGQANGGNGGKGQSLETSGPIVVVSAPAENGAAGGIVYDAQGVDTDIYFSGATPSVAFPTADGYIRAPSGGDGGIDAVSLLPPAHSGNGGNGGDGRNPGTGGPSGDAEGVLTELGDTGSNGEIDGTGSGWGNAGVNNDAIGGLAGSGVKDNGATVVFFGDTPARYINGTGDH